MPTKGVYRGNDLAASIRLVLLLAVLLPVTIVLVPVQLFFLLFSRPLARKLPMLWHRFTLSLIGVRVHVHGSLAEARPLMLAANHVSWADIIVLGGIGEICFIAKDDVKSWPVINWLAKLQRTVFVNRHKRSDSAAQSDTIAQRLVDGDIMVLFAEGTTGTGNKVLPFKSALFGAPQKALSQAHVNEITVQPVAIAYNKLHGMPLGRYHQALAAWPGDLTLFPHLMAFLREGAFDVDVAFGKPHIFDKNTKRKEIANEVFAETHDLFSKLRRFYHRN